MINKPYSEQILENKKIRTFDENVEDDELKWHRDYEDRLVRVIKSDNWQLQMDNDLPQPLIENNEYFIKMGEYHRVIKGKGDLIVEITFL